MRFTTVFACLSAGLVAPAIARSIFSSTTFPGEDHKVPGESPMYHCDGDHDSDLLTIFKIDIEPNPPKPGRDLVITASGSFSKTIEDGAYARVTVKLGLIRLFSQTVDACEKGGDFDIKCPINEGNITITKSVTLPAEIPPAKFNVVADVYSVDDEPITCLTANVNFMPRRSLGGYEDSEDL